MRAPRTFHCGFASRDSGKPRAGHRAPLVPWTLLALITVGCSWGAFNDFKSDTPVFAFANKSFGVLVGVSTNVDQTAILGTAGNPGEGSRYYALKDGKSDPTGDPLSNNAVCTLDIANGRACLLGNEIVGVGELTDSAGQHPGCFALGYGKISDDPTVDPGALVYCPVDGHIFTLGAPKDNAPLLTKAFFDRNESAIRSISISFAALVGGASSPPILLGDEADNSAFVYSSIVAGNVPTLLARPSKANRFGHVVAMGRGAGKTFFAVGAPGDGKVYAYEGDPAAAGAIAHVGCAGDGTQGSGDVIAFGDVDGDNIDDLLVAQGAGAGRVVQVYLGKDEPAKTTSECGNPWPASKMVLKCSDIGGAGGCAGDVSFAASIAVGDLDGDGVKEVAVGAPHASAEGNGGSGVVFLYKPLKSLDVQDVRYLGKPDSGASFGARVAIGKVGGQDTLAVAAPGTGKSYVVWCTNLPGAPGGPRCRK